MNNFVRKLLTEWRELGLPFVGETVLIAVSGGADSVSLALALHDLEQAEKLNLKFVIGHFNHDLRGEISRQDADFVEDLARKINFQFIGGIQNPNSKLENQKGNLEQLARNARYEFLENTAAAINAFIVLTAHTLNDQTETFLLRLLRGSGADGLGAMRKVRFFQYDGSAIKLVRPLLSWAKREDTEDFCRFKKIDFRSDAMNENLNFSRVRVRKELIPMLQTFNPNIVEKISNTAFLLQQDSAELNEEAKKILEKVRCKSTKNIKITHLAEFSQNLRRRVLRLWLAENIFNLRQIESSHIESIEKLMFSRKSGRKTELPNGINIIKSDGKLHFEKSKVEKSPSDN